MNFYNDRILTFVRKWNRKVLCEDDFWRIAKKLKVRVSFIPLQVTGFHYFVRGINFISVDNRLKGRTRLLIMFHELGHCIMHTEPGIAANFYHVGERTRRENEADGFAWCCLFPQHLLLEKTTAELTEEHDFTLDDIEARRAIYERYGI